MTIARASDPRAATQNRGERGRARIDQPIADHDDRQQPLRIGAQGNTNAARLPPASASARSRISFTEKNPISAAEIIAERAIRLRTMR